MTGRSDEVTLQPSHVSCSDLDQTLPPASAALNAPHRQSSQTDDDKSNNKKTHSSMTTPKLTEDDDVTVIKIGFDENESLEEVVSQLRQVFLAGPPSTSPPRSLCLGRAEYLLEANEGLIAVFLEENIIKSNAKHLKKIQLEFDSGPTPIPQDSKRERKWLKLQHQVQKRTHDMARNIQRKLDLDETEIRVDGHVKQEMRPTGDILHRGVAVISFPKVVE